jgi:hypothetical protein
MATAIIIHRREKHADMVRLTGTALLGTAKAIVFDTGVARVFLDKNVITVEPDGKAVRLPRWLAKQKGLVS